MSAELGTFLLSFLTPVSQENLGGRMNKKGYFWLIGLGLCLIALSWGLEPTNAANSNQVETAVSTAPYPDYNAQFNTTQLQSGGECDIYAVDLIGAWVDAGAADGNFSFTSLNDESCTGDFTTDVLPLFTTEDAWFEGSQACTECHFDNSEDSRHEMDLSSHAGIMLGGDVLSDPPGVAIVIPGNWSDSKLRARLRNNRMPPGWEFDIEETNRDGPLLEHDGGNVFAVELIGAWVNAGAPDGDFAWADTDGAEHSGSFEADVLPLFTEKNAWFEGSQACTECHFDNSEDSRHEMNLGSYAGIMLGGDVLSAPPGVAIVVPGDWDASKLRARLRNNRMPPGWEFDIEETNRDGPIVSVGALTVTSGDSCEVYAVDLIGAWVDAGAPELDAFAFSDSSGAACAGTFESDVLPLFAEENAWFEGSQACTECHFDNSEDSRHEMNLGSYAGIMLGGDVLSAPPGVAIVVPGSWSASKLRGRLRDNRMPPDWEFDIEETNRDGPLLEHDGGNVYAVELIGAWVNAGAPEGDFTWLNMDGSEHAGSFESDVLPLFTDENAWFEGSQACTECHFDNSEDSRHEMDLSSYAGIMLGGDVLSDPPGVAIVLPGDWDNSKLRARLRNNRMPPGWEFDIEETNRDGPLVLAGYFIDGAGLQPMLVSAETVVVEESVIPVSSIDEAGTAPIPPKIPEPTITETVMEPVYRPMFLALFGVMTVVFGVAMGFSSAVQLRKPETQTNKTDYVRNIFFLLFAVLAVLSSGLAVHATVTDAFTRTTMIREEVPLPINMVPEIPAVAEVRLEEWQAKIPPAYAALSNPFADDAAAVAAGQAVYESHDCYECHGENLDGDGKFSEGLKPRPVNLTDPALMNLPFITDSYLFWRISEGGSQAPFFSAMPAWKAYLTETERWQVVAYIRSQVGTQMSESDQAAIAVIEQGGCFACHRIEALGRGGKIGPGWDELGEAAASRVPGMSAEAYIRESILQPQAFTVAGFEDQANTMPADFGETLSAEEIDMLVNFLVNLSFDED
jgi:mono/diheme cytochrome c family protein